MTEEKQEQAAAEMTVEQAKEELERHARIVEDTTNNEASARENFDPDLIGRLWEAKTPTDGSAMRPGQIIEQSRVGFVLDGSQCTPNFFCDKEGVYYDVRVTVEALDSASEIEALKGVTDPAQAPFMLAKACFAEINGARFKHAAQRDFFWEGLGMKGRTLVMLAYNSIGSASEAALGKFHRSFSEA